MIDIINEINMHRIIQFYEKRDEAGIRRFLNGLIKAGLNYAPGSDRENLEDLFIRSVDSIARIADHFTKYENLGKALGRFIMELKTYDCVIGPVREFYRKSINYKPIEPSLN